MLQEQFFAERIAFQIAIILLSGIAIAWIVIALHALWVASENPIRALRYE